MQFFHESHDECERRSNETGLLRWRGGVGRHEDASWNWNLLRDFLQSDDCMTSVRPNVVYLSLQRSVSRSWCTQHFEAAGLYVLSMSGDQALPSAGCVSVPLSSILWCVASVSTLVFFPLLLLAQLELRDAPPGIWKSWNDSLKQAETLCFFGFG